MEQKSRRLVLLILNVNWKERFQLLILNHSKKRWSLAKRCLYCLLMEISMILFLTITPRQGYNRIYCFSFLACSRYCLLRSHSCPLAQDKDIVEFFCPFLACFGYCPMVRETILGCCSSFVGEKGQKRYSKLIP